MTRLAWNYEGNADHFRIEYGGNVGIIPADQRETEIAPGPQEQDVKLYACNAAGDSTPCELFIGVDLSYAVVDGKPVEFFPTTIGVTYLIQRTTDMQTWTEFAVIEGMGDLYRIEDGGSADHAVFRAWSRKV